MSKNDLDKALHRPPDIDLDNLESDIWKAVEAEAEDTRIVALLAPWQFAVIAMALVGSVVGGNIALHNLAYTADGLGAFSAEIPLAPSSILLGPHS